MKTNTDCHFFLGWSVMTGKWAIFTRTGWHCDLLPDEDGPAMVKELEMQKVKEEVEVGA